MAFTADPSTKIRRIGGIRMDPAIEREREREEFFVLVAGKLSKCSSEYSSICIYI